jgi:hypothetical protein
MTRLPKQDVTRERDGWTKKTGNERRRRTWTSDQTKREPRDEGKKACVR